MVLLTDQGLPIYNTTKRDNQDRWRVLSGLQSSILIPLSSDVGKESALIKVDEVATLCTESCLATCGAGKLLVDRKGPIGQEHHQRS